MTPENQMFPGPVSYFLRILGQAPDAVAQLEGSPDYPTINGNIEFYQTAFGVMVSALVYGLPMGNAPCDKKVFAFHIHGGSTCTGNDEDPFADALIHYNPGDCQHPNHAGDLLPLWGNRGYAFEVFVTDRFQVEEIMGKTVIVHENRDDFSPDPSGNAGSKIACGEIVRNQKT